MREKQLQRMLRVMRKTGDKAFVMDAESDAIFMMMNLDHYEAMLGASPGEPEPEDNPRDEFGDRMLDDAIDAFEKEKQTAAPVEVAKATVPHFERIAEQQTAKEKPQLEFPAEVEEDEESSLFSEENLSDIPNDGEEERFYLEPVE